MLDYGLLRVIWWLLLGVLLTGFAVMDGFDFGVGMLLPFIAKKDEERRVVINTVGPIWEGNQVWLILGAGAIFAAWPAVYAVSFSGFYFGMLLVLAGLIIRPVAFKYRSKMPSALWRRSWDWGLFIGGFVPALVFGIAVGNVLQGAPFRFDATLRMFYSGDFFGLLNPFALFCGLVSIVMLLMHGGVFANLKTQGNVQRRAVVATRVSALLFILAFAVGGWWIAKGVYGFNLMAPVLHNGPSNPLHKAVNVSLGGWMTHYAAHPWIWLFPVLAFVAALSTFFLVARRELLAFVSSGLAVVGVMGTVGATLFPFILPSSTMPNDSLLVWDASSSQTTLQNMLIAAVIFMPIIIIYTSWVYRVMRGKVTHDIINKEHNAY